MSAVSNFIEDAIKRKNHRHRQISQAEENQANELAKLKENLSIIEDETKKSRENIEKNLNSIMSHRHSIYKTQDSRDETGLPITNTYHGEFMNFISNTMSFMNEIGENENHHTENSLNAPQLSANVQMCNENIMKQIRKENNVVDEVHTIMENIQTVKESYTPIIEEELPLSESSFFDGI